MYYIYHVVHVSRKTDSDQCLILIIGNNITYELLSYSIGLIYWHDFMMYKKHQMNFEETEGHGLW